MWQGHFFNVFGVCYAFAYIAIGLFMATTKKWKNLSTNNLLIILAIGFTYCCIDTGAVSIGYQPVAFAIVALCLKWQIASKSLYFDYCRNISTYIYLVHPFGILLASIIGNHSIEIWLYSLLISLIIAILISILKRMQII